MYIYYGINFVFYVLLAIFTWMQVNRDNELIEQLIYYTNTWNQIPRVITAMVLVYSVLMIRY